MTLRGSPMRTFLRSAVSESSSAWAGPRGAWPEVSFTGLRSFGFQA